MPWGEIFSALQDTDLGAEDMRDLQAYMQERIKAQQDASAQPAPKGEDEEEEDEERRRRRRRIGAQEAEEEEGRASTQPPSPAASSAAFDWKATLASFKEQTKTIDRSIALRKAGNERLTAGDLEGAQQQYQEALAVLEAGTVVHTGRTRRCGLSCRLNMAVVETKKGEYERAREMYSTLLAEAEEGTEEKAVRLQCLVKRAKLSRRLGKMEEAMADLIEANRLKPSDGKVAAELEEMGGTPVPPPPPPSPVVSPSSSPSPLDALFGGEGLGGAPGGGGGGMDLLGGLLGSTGDGGGGGGGGGLGGGLEGLLGNYMQSMGARVVDMLEQPETLNMVCGMVKKLQPEYLKSLAQTANLPLSDGTIRWIHGKATGLEPADIKRWVGRGKMAHKTYKTTKRTWASVQPLVRPMRLLVTYALVLRWFAACLY